MRYNSGTIPSYSTAKEKIKFEGENPVSELITILWEMFEDPFVLT